MLFLYYAARYKYGNINYVLQNKVVIMNKVISLIILFIVIQVGYSVEQKEVKREIKTCHVVDLKTQKIECK